jgi:hypothetical protein
MINYSGFYHENLYVLIYLILLSVVDFYFLLLSPCLHNFSDVIIFLLCGFSCLSRICYLVFTCLGFILVILCYYGWSCICRFLLCLLSMLSSIFCLFSYLMFRIRVASRMVSFHAYFMGPGLGDGYRFFGLAN